MRREKHVKSFLKRLAAGAAATLMTVTTIIVNVEPMKARANDGYYTVIDQYNEFYGSVFGDLDPDMPGWWSTHFTVEDSDGETYSAMCAQPHVKTAENGQVVIDGDTYSSDEADDDRATYARILYWSIGHGGETGGPLYGYSYELRWIIAHHAFALAKGDENWNTSQSGNTFLRSDSIGYDLVMELWNYAANITTGDWHCYVKYLVNDEGYQDLLLYSEKYVPPPYDGSIKIKKSSDNETITNGNSCYSLAGAEFSVYNDEDCTDYLTTLVTDENGDTDTYTVHDIPKDETKTLYYKETKAPKGFLLDDAVHSITIEGEGTWTGYVEDVPETDPVTIFLRKINKETGGVSNGDGTLVGAKYVVKYYDTDKTTDPAKDGLEPKYTWKVQTDENGYVDLQDSNSYISGDDVITVDGDVVFPLGTVTVQEYEAPTGYLVDKTVFVRNMFNRKLYVNGVEQKLATSYQEAEDTIIHLEQGVKGKISIKKTKQVIKDANAKAVLSSGKDTLTEAVPESGAVFRLYLKSAGSYDDAADDARDILYTDKNGLATSKDLVYGNYVLHQISGEDGFMMLDDMEVSITENGKTYQLAGNDAQKYSKLRLYKTGEVLTGYDSTNGFTYASKYVGGCTYGVYTDAECTNLIEKITTVDDTYAESRYEYLPGTYYVKELSTDGNYLLDSKVHKVEVVLDKDAEIGFTDVSLSDERQKVNIEINKTDIDTGAVLSDTTFGIYATTDIVDRKGKVVAAKGTLLEKLVTGENGKATAAFDYPTGYVYEVKELKAPMGYGNKNDVKKVDASGIKGNEPSQDYSLKFTDKHTSIASTKAAEYKTGDNQGAYDENFVYRIIDSVDCRDLVVGEEYTIKGMLKDKATGLPFVDMDGNTVTGETTFTAETEDQIVNVEFNFKANLEGLSIVVCESLYQQGVEIYVHDSMEDKDQTIDYLKLRTKAHDKETGTNVGTVSETATIVDSVMFNNLRVGSTYEVNGYLMNKDTGSELLDKNGNRITATKIFTAESTEQTVDMEFTLDSSLLEGTTVTVFEDVYYNGVKAGTHCDITNADQSIFYPKIRTSAADGDTNSHVGVVGGKSTIVDTVTYTNLIVGKTYTVSGYLMNQDTNTAILDKDGNKITSSRTFTAATANGSIDITFEFDSSDMEGSTAVVFEDLYHNDIRVTTHSDITNSDQSILYLKIRTKAHDKNTGDHNGTVGPETTIIDTVTYTNLIAGREYTLKGYLVDRATQMPLRDSEGNLVSSTKNFVANNANGTVDMEFTFDSTGLGDHILVVFEDIYDTESGVKLTSHSDIGSEEQSIYYIDVKTKAHDKQTGNNVGVVTDKAVIVDTVSYNGLIVGNTYSVSGHLMVKGTGMPLLDKNGNKITANTTFVAQTSNGTVDMVFEFDSSLLAGETILCFEKVYHNGIEVACHEDLNNEDQSTFYPQIKTTANDGISGTKYNNGAEDIVIVDTVSYKNLIVGKEYVIKGVLKDKATGKSVINKATGKEVTSEIKFTAEQKDGSIDVTFNFTRADLAGRTVVIFEKLYQNEIEVTAHEDLSDEGQTIVEPTKIGIIKIDDTSKTKKPLSGATLQILDKDGNVVEVEILTETKDENGNTVAAVKKATSFVSGLEETVIIGLEPGTYKIHEVAAPWGYELTEDVVFVLGDKVELQHFVMADEAKVGLMNFSYNEKKDFEVAADSALVTPQTGDSSYMLKYMVIMLVSGIALLGCLFGKNKKAFIKVFGAVFVFLAVAFAGNTRTYAATTFTEEEKFESENKEAEYDFKKNKSKDGLDYTLTDVKYDVKAKQIANITKTNTVLVTDAAPVFEESIVENGITYRLKSVTTAEGDMGSRSVTYTKVYTYNGLTKTDDIPAVVAGSVRDEATNEVSTVNMTQTGLVKKNEQKSDDFVFSINVVSGAYFMYKDNIVEYNAENPNLMQYKDSILEDLGLSKDIYTVESIEWTSEPEADADGMIHREATVKGYKEIADYEATYVATVDYPTANVVYTADYEADTTKNTTFYEIKGTATYQLTSEIVDTNASGTKKTDFKSVFKNPVVVGSFSAVVIVIIAVIAIVLWKKKLEKEVVE